MKGWVIGLIIMSLIISLVLNVVIGYFIYQDPDITFDNRKETRTRQTQLDYKSFEEEWGNAWLGLEVTDVTPEVAARKMLDRVEGAFVKSITAGSPARKTDITPGDVVLSFNERKIRTADQFRSDVAGSEIGSEVYMCVAKDDRRITVYLVPEERPPHLPVPTKSFPFLGIYVCEVVFSSDEAKKLEEAGKAGGVWVEKITPDSPAARAGLQEGDIIMSFNSRKTRSLREFFSDLAGSQAGTRVRMCIMRDDYRKTISVTLGTTGTHRNLKSNQNHISL